MFVLCFFDILVIVSVCFGFDFGIKDLKNLFRFWLRLGEIN